MSLLASLGGSGKEKKTSEADGTIGITTASATTISDIVEKSFVDITPLTSVVPVASTSTTTIAESSPSTDTASTIATTATATAGAPAPSKPTAPKSLDFLVHFILFFRRPDKQFHRTV